MSARGPRIGAAPSTSVERDERCRLAERLLRDRGIDNARVTAAGHEDEIAAVCTAPEHLDRVGALADEIRALGFRYVTLDLTGPDVS